MKANKENKNNNKNIFTKKSKSIFYDRLAKWVIYSVGVITIAAVLGILAFVFYEAMPLWSGTTSKTNLKQNSNKFLNEKFPLSGGIDEYKEVAYFITDSATIDFVDIKHQKFIKSIQIEGVQNSKITTTSSTSANHYIGVGNDSGTVSFFKIQFHSEFDKNNVRKVIPGYLHLKTFSMDSSKRSITKLITVYDDYEQINAVALIDNSLKMYYTQKSESLIDEGEETEHVIDLSGFVDEKITSFNLDNQANKLLAGTDKGNVYFISLTDKENPVLYQKFKASKYKLTTLGFILGDQSVIIGDEAGNVSSRMIINDEHNEYSWKFIESHNFDKMKSAVTDFSASQRNKCFVMADIEGNVKLYHLTTEQTLLESNGISGKVLDVMLSPKSDGILCIYGNGLIYGLDINNPHPDVTFKTLFGKILYEGYKKPEYVWQSTGGSDDFEPKFSLIPLIFGTIKGTIYALVFAIPIALFGALYTSLFSHPKIKNIIKPTVEIMAALPSVVIGFLAGLWLAPVLEKILPSVFLMLIILPVVISLGVWIWNKLQNKFKMNNTIGYEIFIILPLILLGIWISMANGDLFEKIFFAGDFRTWLKATLDIQYDQRNSIVVGFAMGFAVIPIIFTICEDALTTVPKHLTSASLALGATRWQTALRIVLPSASPGIFSAIMIGFGRAIGETMIVLMATGNTPILDLSPFNGMRTLSANIAVEIPKAPHNGSLYRVLFLSAALLFLFTFLINTFAEIIRQRMRKQYMHI